MPYHSIYFLGVVHKWRHVIFDNFLPLPLSSSFLLLRPSYCRDTILDPLLLWPWRRLRTTPYYFERTFATLSLLLNTWLSKLLFRICSSTQINKYLTHLRWIVKAGKGIDQWFPTVVPRHPWVPWINYMGDALSFIL